MRSDSVRYVVLRAVPALLFRALGKFRGFSFWPRYFPARAPVRSVRASRSGDVLFAVACSNRDETRRSSLLCGRTEERFFVPLSKDLVPLQTSRANAKLYSGGCTDGQPEGPPQHRLRLSHKHNEQGTKMRPRTLWTAPPTPRVKSQATRKQAQAITATAMTIAIAISESVGRSTESAKESFSRTDATAIEFERKRRNW